MIYESFEYEEEAEDDRPYDEFMEKVGIIRDYYELHQIGIDSDSLLGGFYGSNSRRLKVYCSKDPAYHIVSHLRGSRWVNRYEPRAVSYFLADGDNDPELELEISEDGVDQLNAMVAHVYTCLKVK
jgi:hypothetical protein